MTQQIDNIRFAVFRQSDIHDHLTLNKGGNPCFSVKGGYKTKQKNKQKIHDKYVLKK